MVSNSQTKPIQHSLKDLAVYFCLGRNLLLLTWRLSNSFPIYPSLLSHVIQSKQPLCILIADTALAVIWSQLRWKRIRVSFGAVRPLCKDNALARLRIRSLARVLAFHLSER